MLCPPEVSQKRTYWICSFEIILRVRCRSRHPTTLSKQWRKITNNTSTTANWHTQKHAI